MDSIEHASPAEDAVKPLDIERLARFRFAGRWAKDRRVLVVVYGTSRGREVLAAAGARVVVAGDISPKAAARPSGEADLLRVSEATLPFPSRCFDLVLSFDTMDRVQDAATFVAELRRVLRQDGLLFVSSPNHPRAGSGGSSRLADAVPGLSALLARHFRQVRILPHIPLLGSAVIGDPGGALDTDLPRGTDPAAAPSVVAICGEALPEVLPSSVVAGAPSGDHAQDLGAPVGMGDGRSETAFAISPFDDDHSAMASEQARRLRALGARHAAVVAKLRSELALAQAALAQLRRGRAFRVIARYWSLKAWLRERAAPLATWMARWRRRVASTASLASDRAATPLVSVVVPVHQHAEYLPLTIESILEQTYRNIELLLWDDASPDPRVREILASYARRDPRVRHYRSEANLGISGATNEAIIRSSGEWVAFVDCDDLLVANAIESVIDHARRHPDIGLVFTNRIDIDERGAPMRQWDFATRAIGDIRDELLKGMFVSHLKTVRREALMRAGLLRSRFDLSQDYDHVLRLADVTKIGFLREALYRHRVHSGQSTRRHAELQERRAEHARGQALLRRDLASGRFEQSVSIVLLARSRPGSVRRCLESVQRNTAIPYQAIVLDSASDEPTRDWLRQHLEVRPRSKLVCVDNARDWATERREALRQAEGDIIVTLGGDIEVAPGWIEQLLSRLMEDPDVGGACCRVALPDGSIHFTGGACVVEDGFIRFSLLGSGLSVEDLASLREQDCGWIPGCATAFLREVYAQIESSIDLEGAFGEQLFSLMARRAGWRLVNAPLATVRYHTAAPGSGVAAHADTVETQGDPSRLWQAIVDFHKLTGLIIEDESLYRSMGMPTDRPGIRDLLLHAPTLIARQRS